MNSAQDTTDKTSFQCPECEEFFTRSNNLVRHIRNIHKNNAEVIEEGIAKPHKCDFPDCTRSFDTEQGLLIHYRRHNPQTSGATHKHVCDLCSKSWKHPGLLKEHIAQKHSTNRDHHCTFPGCKKSFHRKNGLKAHQRKHSSNIKCPTCGRICATQTTLTVHMRTHTGELPFKCPYPPCKKGFAQQGNLTTHIKKHHSD